ncbi:hypothetical protein F943_02672 [Acinetobacter ursingii NIPH 706]|nr:hypothetical protein F943_02672 [Acinetobacter ursingii NIPH 706]
MLISLSLRFLIVSYHIDSLEIYSYEYVEKGGASYRIDSLEKHAESLNIRLHASYHIDSLEKSTQIICFCSTAFYRIDSLENVTPSKLATIPVSYRIGNLFIFETPNILFLIAASLKDPSVQSSWPDKPNIPAFLLLLEIWHSSYGIPSVPKRKYILE